MGVEFYLSHPVDLWGPACEPSFLRFLLGINQVPPGGMGVQDGVPVVEDGTVRSPDWCRGF